MTMKKSALLMLSLFAVIMSGCATAERSFLLDLTHKPAVVSAEKSVDMPIIALNRLSDSRTVSDKTQIGDGINSAAKMDRFFLHGQRLEILLTDALEDQLRAAGFEVKRIMGWDRNPETVTPDWGDIIVGGEIIDFWLETDASAIKYDARSKAKIRLAMIDARTKNVLTSSVIEKSASRSGALMKKEDLEGMLVDIYSGVIKQILQDETLKEKLRRVKR